MASSVEKPQPAVTDQSTHIIDPDGEAIIVLHNPNAPFAEPSKVVPKPTPAAEESVENGTGENEAAEQLDENCIRIQVSAKHLILASPVFKKILSGNWKESVTYLQKGSVEITADSWDIEALLILLRIIHCQFYSIPRKLTLEMLAKVAVLADYYDCREVVDCFANTWINALGYFSTTFSRDLVMSLWIAWYFQLPTRFNTATSVAISQGTNLIDNLGLPIPENVMRSLNDGRRKAIACLVDQLHKESEALLNGSRGCGFECSSIMYGALTKQMHSNALLSPKPVAPFPGLGYKHLVQIVSSLKSPEWYQESVSISIYHENEAKQHVCVYSTFKSVFGVLNDTIKGLDLNNFVSH